MAELRQWSGNRRGLLPEYQFGRAGIFRGQYDPFGRIIWHKDGDGFLDYTAYDPATGVVIKTITDVNINKTVDFQNLPSGWVTPANGGLHLITQYEVDMLGRTTKQTDPTDVNTPTPNVTYTVYDDPDHEIRVYPGWQSATNTPTGPTA